jgi:hypothetical protein
MAVLVAERVDRPASLFEPAPERVADPAEARRREHDDGLGGGLTLDDAIVGVWEGLVARATVACPLCGGALQPRLDGGAVGGRCGGCGTTLA